MRVPANFVLSDDGGVYVIKPSGDWTVLDMGDAADRLRDDLAGRAKQRRFDAHDLGRIDTAGTFALMRTLASDEQPRIEADLAGRNELRRLAELVEPSIIGEPSPAPHKRSTHDLFDRIGRVTVAIGAEVWNGQVFAGRMMVALARVLGSGPNNRIPCSTGL